MIKQYSRDQITGRLNISRVNNRRLLFWYSNSIKSLRCWTNWIMEQCPSEYWSGSQMASQFGIPWKTKIKQLKYFPLFEYWTSLVFVSLLYSTKVLYLDHRCPLKKLKVNKVVWFKKGQNDTKKWSYYRPKTTITNLSFIQQTLQKETNKILNIFASRTNWTVNI